MFCMFRSMMGGGGAASGGDSRQQRTMVNDSGDEEARGRKTKEKLTNIINEMIKKKNN